MSTAKFALLGHPLAHSMSPFLHQRLFEAAGVQASYELLDAVPEELDAAVERLREFDGFNITIPYKQSILPYLDEVDGTASFFGSVNTVKNEGGRLIGCSTDGDGFLRALREAGLDPAGRTVLLLGAGGAARAAAPKLARAGAERVYVCNRTPERAAQLCAGDPAGRLAPAGMDGETLARLAPRCSLLVNCTSLGMEGTGGQFDDLSFVDALPGGAGVFDLIYSPAETGLLRRARGRGLPAANGLGMLIWQAVLALEFFLDRPLDGPAMARLLREAMT